MPPPAYNPVDWEFFRPLRLKGGVAGALRAAGHAWWGEALRLTAVNFLWALSLFSIIGLAPATAALFYVARQALAGDYIGLDALWYPFRRYFWDACRWGLALLLVGAIALTNLWFYRDSAGGVLALLRGLWGVVALLWGGFNLFFWPFWFSQVPEQRTLRTTWRNCFAFLLANPLPVLLVFALVGLLALLVLNVVTSLWLFTVVMVWPALLATAMVTAHLPRD